MDRPTIIVAGDTYTWTVSSSDYPASAGYALKVSLNNQNGFKQVTAATAANGEDYDVTLSAVDSGQLPAGVYTLHEAVESGTGASIVRHTVFRGTVTVQESPTRLTTPTDIRSDARIMLDTITATIKANLGRGHESMSIAARMIGYRSWEEMLRVRDRLKREVKAEDDADAIEQGLEPNKPVLTRFGGVI